KYGLNGTIPAGTSSRVGSSAIRLAEGTTRCPRSSKNRRYRRAISADSMSGILLVIGTVIDDHVSRLDHPAACAPAQLPGIAGVRDLEIGLDGRAELLLAVG